MPASWRAIYPRPVGSASRTAATVGAVLALGLALVDASLVTLAAPALIERFDETINAVAWTVNGYNLVLALLVVLGVPVGRWIGDVLAARIGVAVFASGAFMASVAPALVWVIGGRVIMAVGAALIVPATLAVLMERRPPNRALALWVATGGVAAAMGPALGGALTATLSWRAVFWAQVPVAAVAFALLPWRRRVRAERVAAAATTVSADPRGRAWPDRRARIGASAALVPVGAGIAASLFLLVLFLIEVWAYGPLAAAGILTPLAVGTVASAPLFARLMRRTGPAPVVVGGIVCFAAGLGGAALLPAAPSLLPALGIAAVLGLGLGAILGPLTQSAMQGLAERPLVAGAALHMAIRHAGLVLGLGVLIAVLTAEVNRQTNIADVTVGSQVAASALPTPLVTSLAFDLYDVSRASPDTGPEFGPVFAARRGEVAPADLPAYDALAAQVLDEVRARRARAFVPAFGWAAVLALLATAPAAWALGGLTSRRGRRRLRTRGADPLGAAGSPL